VQVSGDVRDLRHGEVELRHAFREAAVLDYGSNQLARPIVQQELRADEIRAVVAAAGVFAMAQSAIDVIDGFTAGEHIGRRRRTLRIRSASSTATLRRGSSTSRGSLRGNLHRSKCGRSQQNQE